MRVSVVVPVRNGGRDVPELLERLAVQTVARDRYEVVLADDGSTDGALDGVADHDWVRVERAAAANAYAARNRAARVTRGRALAFCDVDCRPEANWLEAGLAALERAELAAGRIVFAPPARPSTWTLLSADLLFDEERWAAEGVAATANLFVRRETFDAVGGFDETLPSSGDFDFVARCVQHGARLQFASEAVVRHPTCDRARRLLGKLWFYNRWVGFKFGREGRLPGGAHRSALLPVVGFLLERRRTGRAMLRLDRLDLARHGLRPPLGDEARAMLALCALAAPVVQVARLRGWCHGYRVRRARALT